MAGFPWDEEEWDGLSSEEKREKIKDWIKRNRTTAASIGLGLAGATIVAAPSLVTAPFVGILGLVGFGSGGIVGGSFAAGAQAMLGNVVAGSWFASATSAAMGGYGLAGLTTAVQSAGVYTSVAGLVSGLLNGNGHEGDDEDGNAETSTDEAGPSTPKGPKDDRDGSGAEITSRASQEIPREKDFDEETTLFDDSGASDEDSFIQVPEASPVGRRIIIDL
ncbi:hypothetical protein SMACR_12734 [Sordaria macrospora]|uniref:WGS project CABT00000000 data, contig 2.2 n=2 Tax=Sordaria macrospora TaxID=5147 RepID=F7VMA9_SORMK|nr:uncharacterized protein SMAC_12734 [Sordaria macrospora k-hell]KAA8631774.1 hypothetical protein SMACR_12734 [Sordaria macrospora]WPJ62348.1 hypothetical protein SMAC4_12734 [Sordaria macrospora]CCC07089.1 unnamed protein product [Sordaria macrospora k-hell]